MSRRLVAVVGPSGAGKDTLMALACAARPDIRAARRVVTRPAEAGGEDFEPVTEAEFAARERAGAFALHWRAHGLGYGIPADALAGEGTLLINASRAVLAEAQARFPDLTVLLVTAPPEVLARRLAGRGRESGADQAARLARAGFPLPPGLAPRVVMNDGTPDQGLARFLAALQPERV
ncbi:phosphonate metabolism protein/1,5-bisphosphokinase (PRPP-forming) PhnN [Paracoccus sp. PS-1]|uniref:phosphonate metabolism protein/1,5-bisphosphokinase (PRPP-forming) PhnN n=1 Tax=unclassified Paracoccus (in: a-proteobacteria) TaxID=2688777 RepID=UPI00048DF9D2|nr:MULTISPECIES: phosphonate metabolism protein/1,5-bisphosphokinase (PRPP-forming) PhnN [unclassified Paracoccus (in: a-proteobacteria)]MDQ7263055.1 phosphonate metabolism protein/1,5-bisphosphokinase (PRPP-forming) PhnN [Paracoccus sp. PS1]RQP05811.1 MAG: phosphonate metabolism protein/1,5-bisphosphokinase (PRPP-forming) PhnN [Paracoccus sp. BP8]UFM67236.1 phosphonate metabolism protein/1,5-bisphosphokinase (PRPP-forming) PhnN [Paracoccus sp. MA]